MRHRLPLGLKLAYGLGSVSFGVKDAGLQFFLLLYYNQVLGLPASWVGAASAAALCIDAALDPLIGYWSDNLHSRWGRRHPLMYAAVLPIALCYGLLWDPPAGLTPGQLSLYLLGMVVLVRVLISFYEVPNSALTAELTDDYDERTAVVGWRLLFGLAGGLGMVVLALVAFLRPTGTEDRGPTGRRRLCRIWLGVGHHHVLNRPRLRARHASPHSPAQGAATTARLRPAAQRAGNSAVAVAPVAAHAAAGDPVRQSGGRARGDAGLLLQHVFLGAERQAGAAASARPVRRRDHRFAALGAADATLRQEAGDHGAGRAGSAERPTCPSCSGLPDGSRPMAILPYC